MCCSLLFVVGCCRLSFVCLFRVGDRLLLLCCFCSRFVCGSCLLLMLADALAVRCGVLVVGCCCFVSRVLAMCVVVAAIACCS